MPSTYVYVVVRKDLCAEQQAVQACHAALQAGYEFGAPAQPPNLVLLHTQDEDSLQALLDRARAKGVRATLFFEPDDNMGYSAFATEPLSCRKKRAAFSKSLLFHRECPLAQSI